METQHCAEWMNTLSIATGWIEIKKSENDQCIYIFKEYILLVSVMSSRDNEEFYLGSDRCRYGWLYKCIWEVKGETTQIFFLLQRNI